MYGADNTQAAALAATGSAVLGGAGYVLAAGVLILAGATLITILSVIRHRAKGSDDG